MNFIELDPASLLCSLIPLRHVITGQHYLETVTVKRLSWHSQFVEPGDTFLAIPVTGQHETYRQYIQQAINNGAKWIICQHDHYHVPENTAAAFITVDNVRALRAHMAKQIFPHQPAHVVAVTGTNGKTSVVQFCHQLWQLLGCTSASIGTLGLQCPSKLMDIAEADILTSPDPFVLHQTLHAMAQAGVTHVALEASSHGLDQYRLHGVDIAAGGFTNLTQDHLDYHGTMQHYLQAKIKLFTQVLRQNAQAVLNADSDVYDQLVQTLSPYDLKLLRYGRQGADLQLNNIEIDKFQQIVHITCHGQNFTVPLKLVGEFQIMNALCAAGLVMATGFTADQVLPLLSRLKPINGRLNYVGQTAAGAAVFIDYAHTPDALQTVLKALRPFTKAHLIMVFGCGGDRDPSKRILMGQVTHELADYQIVTNDNPRYEDPTQIRHMILKGAPNGIEIGDRKLAIEQALYQAQAGDIVVIAGKGHETYQLINGIKHDFDDSQIIEHYLTLHGGQLD